MMLLNEAEILLQRNWSLFVHLAAVVIAVYDYLLTFTAEVEYFWHSTPRYGAFFFYLNRYCTLLGIAPAAITPYWSQALFDNNFVQIHYNTGVNDNLIEAS
ncbi:hypothetical protein GYMLUDRAFT_62278 [Collybiopsis luxurians FD-317 M1]|uniref:DUF6533 domain-containing protein n=1 Tax=Collybiopsis luxurians FD-317 M1 TaxID=944289 RepID=A0A0D0C0Y1_9AGAR|nr:hypothetical protein GYMLUDRAFT_62278 [Collybiopsis luxurians FD-317 M1]